MLSQYVADTRHILINKTNHKTIHVLRTASYVLDNYNTLNNKHTTYQMFINQIYH